MAVFLVPVRFVNKSFHTGMSFSLIKFTLVLAKNIQIKHGCENHDTHKMFLYVQAVND